MMHCYFLNEVHTVMEIHQNLEAGRIDKFRVYGKVDIVWQKYF